MTTTYAGVWRNDPGRADEGKTGTITYAGVWTNYQKLCQVLEWLEGIEAGGANGGEAAMEEAKQEDRLVEFRCVKCNKLLFKASLASGSHVEVVCTRCKELNLEDAS